MQYCPHSASEQQFQGGAASLTLLSSTRAATLSLTTGLAHLCLPGKGQALWALHISISEQWQLWDGLRRSVLFTRGAQTGSPGRGLVTLHTVSLIQGQAGVGVHAAHPAVLEAPTTGG